MRLGSALANKHRKHCSGVAPNNASQRVHLRWNHHTILLTFFVHLFWIHGGHAYIFGSPFGWPLSGLLKPISRTHRSERASSSPSDWSVDTSSVEPVLLNNLTAGTLHHHDFNKRAETTSTRMLYMDLNDDAANEADQIIIMALQNFELWVNNTITENAHQKSTGFSGKADLRKGLAEAMWRQHMENGPTETSPEDHAMIQFIKNVFPGIQRQVRMSNTCSLHVPPEVDWYEAHYLDHTIAENAGQIQLDVMSLEVVKVAFKRCALMEVVTKAAASKMDRHCSELIPNFIHNNPQSWKVGFFVFVDVLMWILTAVAIILTAQVQFAALFASTAFTKAGVFSAVWQILKTAGKVVWEVEIGGLLRSVKTLALKTARALKTTRDGQKMIAQVVKGLGTKIRNEGLITSSVGSVNSVPPPDIGRLRKIEQWVQRVTLSDMSLADDVGFSGTRYVNKGEILRINPQFSEGFFLEKALPGIRRKVGQWLDKLPDEAAAMSPVDDIRVPDAGSVVSQDAKSAWTPERANEFLQQFDTVSDASPDLRPGAISDISSKSQYPVLDRDAIGRMRELKDYLDHVDVSRLSQLDGPADAATIGGSGGAEASKAKFAKLRQQFEANQAGSSRPTKNLAGQPNQLGKDKLSKFKDLPLDSPDRPPKEALTGAKGKAIRPGEIQHTPDKPGRFALDNQGITGKEGAQYKPKNQWSDYVAPEAALPEDPPTIGWRKPTKPEKLSADRLKQFQQPKQDPAGQLPKADPIPDGVTPEIGKVRAGPEGLDSIIDDMGEITRRPSFTWDQLPEIWKNRKPGSIDKGGSSPLKPAQNVNPQEFKLPDLPEDGPGNVRVTPEAPNVKPDVPRLDEAGPRIQDPSSPKVEKPAAIDQVPSEAGPQIEKPVVEGPRVEKPASPDGSVHESLPDQPRVKQPSGEHTNVKQPSGDQSPVKQPSGEQQPANRPNVEQPADGALAKQQTPEQPVAKDPSVDQPLLEQPQVQPPSIDRPDVQQPPAEQAAVDPSVAEQPKVPADMPPSEHKALQRPRPEKPAKEGPSYVESVPDSEVPDGLIRPEQPARARPSVVAQKWPPGIISVVDGKPAHVANATNSTESLDALQKSLDEATIDHKSLLQERDEEDWEKSVDGNTFMIFHSEEIYHREPKQYGRMHISKDNAIDYCQEAVRDVRASIVSSATPPADLIGFTEYVKNMYSVDTPGSPLLTYMTLEMWDSKPDELASKIEGNQLSAFLEKVWADEQCYVSVGPQRRSKIGCNDSKFVKYGFCEGDQQGQTMCFDGRNEDNDPLRGEGHFGMSPLHKERNWSSQIALASWHVYQKIRDRAFMPGIIALDLNIIAHQEEWLPTPILPVCHSEYAQMKQLTGSKDDNVHPWLCGGPHGPETEMMTTAANFQRAEGLKKLPEETMRALKGMDVDPGELISAMCTDYFHVAFSNDNEKHGRPDDDQYYWHGKKFCDWWKGSSKDTVSGCAAVRKWIKSDRGEDWSPPSRKRNEIDEQDLGFSNRTSSAGVSRSRVFRRGPEDKEWYWVMDQLRDYCKKKHKMPK